MPKSGFADISDLVDQYKKDKSSFQNPYDKDFGGCTIGHDIEEMVAKSNILIVGNSHPSRAEGERFTSIIKTHRPTSVIFEVSKPSDAPEEQKDRKKFVQSLIDKGEQADNTEVYYKAAKGIGANIVYADPQSYAEKKDLILKVEALSGQLNSKFNNLIRQFWKSDYDLDTRVEGEELFQNRREVTDPVFADTAVTELDNDPNNQVFLYMGYSHVYHTHRLIEEKGKNSDVPVRVNTLQLISVDQEAMDFLEDAEGFKIKGQYILPVLETGNGALSLNEFMRYIDTVPGTDPAVSQAARVIGYYYGENTTSASDYKKEDMEQCSPSTKPTGIDF